MRKILLLLICMLAAGSSIAQNIYFKTADESQLKNTSGKREIIPNKYNTVAADVNSLKAFLMTLPSEQSVMNRSSAPIMEIPMPDGKTAKFRVWESSIMEPGLAAKFPEIKTYAGQGIDDPYATIRFDYNSYAGFHAQILSSATGRVFIDPYAKGDKNFYISYYVKELSKQERFICETVNNEIAAQEKTLAPQAVCLGTTLRTYKLALACTGEYAVAVCAPNPATVPATLAAMVTSMNRVNGVYEKEVSLRMILIANNTDIIYLNGATDPYTNNNGFTLLGQNQANIDAVIGSANYDIGHVFSTGGGGVATLRSPCDPDTKARGVTGQSNPVGDPFDIDYVAHEMGHQWGGNHTFNSVTSSCGGGNRNGSTAYEVGSGTTIMAYAGICGSDNIQPNSDPFFHAISFDEISNYINAGGNCGVNTATGNTLPVIGALANNGVYIPPSTPFTLNATATDANGDALTYCWEQWDLGVSGAWNSGATAAINNTVPLFKSRVPKTTGERTFPDIAVINAGFPANPAAAMNGLKGETLSPVARPMKFKVTVRDNRAGGGGTVSSGTDGCQAASVFQVNVTGTAPFLVTAPNTTGISWNTGSTQTVTWDVAGTNGGLVNCANVAIELSTDGGLTFPVTVAGSTANDGTESVTVPNNPTTQARIRVRALGNIFFDISNNNFTIVAASPGFDFANPAALQFTCGTQTTATITLGTTQILGYSTPITMSAIAGVPSGSSINFSTNPVNPGSNVDVILTNTNTLAPGNYDITIQGVSGSITKTRVLRYTIVAGAGPAVTTNPNSQTVCEGATVTFTTAATGALSQQWQLSTDGGATFNNIGGQTGTSLTLNSVTASLNNNRYRCVYNGLCNTSNTNAAVLTVQTAPSISQQPAAASVCSGTNATFSVSATGTNLTYQWQLSTDGGNNWANIPTAAANQFTITGVTLSQNNNRYRCIVSGSCTPAVTSGAAVLNVTAPVVINTQPADATFCGSGNPAFNVSASNTNNGFQWQLSTDGGATYNNVSGATTSSLSVNATSTSFNNYRYRVVMNNGVCPAVTSNAALLTINPLPSVILTAAPFTKVFPGLTTTITAAITPSGGTVVWQKNGVAFSNTSNTFNVNIDQLGAYKVVVTGAGGCVGESNVLNILDSATSKIFFYPNPNQGQFLVRYNNPQGAGTQSTIRVFDYRGSKVYERLFSVSRPYDQMFIDLRARGTGIYLVELVDASGKRLATGKVYVK